MNDTQKIIALLGNIEELLSSIDKKLEDLSEENKGMKEIVDHGLHDIKEKLSNIN